MTGRDPIDIHSILTNLICIFIKINNNNSKNICNILLENLTFHRSGCGFWSLVSGYVFIYLFIYF